MRRNVLSFIVLIMLVALAAGSDDTENTEEGSSSTSEYISLNASVNFDGTQFKITNNDSFDWTNVKLEVNSKTFSSGYILKTGRMSAGETYTVGAMQFAKGDGEKFNPFTHKAVNFSISCDTPSGDGFYYGSWD